jgi:hypothetical protein
MTIEIPATKVCARCGGTFDAEAFFRRAHAPYACSASGSHPFCIGCEQELRDRAKVTDRWPTKIRDTIRRHARRLGLTTDGLITEFGWQFEKLLHDAKHAYANGCPFCRVAFSGMGHGPADITLDVTDPTAPPYYAVNTKWCCATCNGARKLACWDKWEVVRALGLLQPRLF